LVVAKADDDGDGFTESAEIAAGTDPRDAASRLTVNSWGMGSASVTINWSSVIGKTYHLEGSSDLSAWNEVTGTRVTATDVLTSASVSSGTGTSKFYRVVVE
jgi:hypothetical protein